MFQKITLKNGLRIITVPQKSTRAVAVLVLVGTGSKYEKKEISGISHFLEHMFFKGTQKRPSKLEIAETLDKIGGIYNAFTGEEHTGYFAKVEASHFDLALDWVADVYLNSLLPEKEVEKEKGVIVEEINMLNDNPMAYVEILWNKLLYGDQPAGWDIAGTKESVAKMTRQKLINYMASQYVASNTIVCLAGKIKNSQAIGRIKKYFAEIKTTPLQTKPKVVDASIRSVSIPSANRRIEGQTGPAMLLRRKKTDQTHLCLGVRGYNLFHPQRYAQDILGIILGGMMSSRLFMAVREKLGIAYYVRTSVDANPDTGFLVTQAGVDNENVEKAILTILKEYKKISQERVPKTELKKAKDYIQGRMALMLESSDALAFFYAGQEAFERKILTQEEIYAKINKITDGDVLRVARDIFQPRGMNLALVGPFNDKNKFRKLLK